MLTPVPTRFDAVALGPAAGAGPAVAAAGGHLTAALDWPDVGELERLGGQPVLLIEAVGADAATLDSALPRVAVAVARGLQVVVTLAMTQMDAVAVHLLGAGVTLLPEPTEAERVTALVLAAREADPGVFAFVGETDAERMARLSAELARLIDLLAQLTRAEPSAAGIADRALTFGAAPVDAVAIDPAEVRRVIRARRVRDRVFGAGLFEDPAWDILLDLFAASLERAEVSVSSLCIAAAVAPTTALRWIGRLTGAGLLVRHRDPFDGRRALMSLSDAALGGMTSYVASLRAGGLPFV